MFKSLSIVVVAFLIQGVVSQEETFDGKCPEVTPLKDYNFKASMGRFYGYAVYPDSPVINNTRCSYGDFVLTGENTAVDNAVGINIDTGAIERDQVAIKSYGGGAWGFAFNNQSVDEVNTHILGTDYKHYSIVYSCKNLENNKHSIVTWVISRDRTLDERYVTEVRKIYQTVNFDFSRTQLYDQTNCPAAF